MADLDLSPELLRRMRTLQDLQHLKGLLEWDQAVRASVDHAARARQDAAVIAAWESILRDDSLLDLIAQAKETELSKPARRALELLEYQANRHRATPIDIAEKFNQLRMRVFGLWLRARENGDYSEYKLRFTDLVNARTEIANYEGFPNEPYDSCVADLEPGLTSEALGHLVQRVLREIEPLIELVNSRDQEAWNAPKDLMLSDPRFVQYVGGLLERVGYDRERGAVAWGPSISVTDVGPTDIRMSLSNRMIGDPLRSVREVMHESGHALYAQAMPPDWAQTPLGDAPSIGLHEAQALFWELHVCRSAQFWEGERDRFIAPFQRLAERDAAWLYRACNRDVPTVDVAEAGEVSYSRHVWLRLELERKLINGDLAVIDLPEACDSLYRKHFGVEGSADRIVHQENSWALGYFGYIPVYLVGRIYAANLARRMREDLGPDEFDKALRGNFQVIRTWLVEKVCSLGGLVASRELITSLSGVDPIDDPSPYVDHLKQRYSEFP